MNIISLLYWLFLPTVNRLIGTLSVYFETFDKKEFTVIINYIIYVLYKFMILNKSKLFFILMSNIIIFLLWPTVFSLKLVWGILILFCGLYIYIELLSLTNFKYNIFSYLLSLVLSISLIITGFVLICKSFQDIYQVLMNLSDLLNPLSEPGNNNDNTGPNNNPGSNPGPSNNSGGNQGPNNNNPFQHADQENDNNKNNHENRGYNDNNTNENQEPNNNTIQDANRTHWYKDDKGRIIIYDKRYEREIKINEHTTNGELYIHNPVSHRWIEKERFEENLRSKPDYADKCAESVRKNIEQKSKKRAERRNRRNIQ